MSQLLEKQRAQTEHHLPRLFRNRTVDYPLLVIGALVAVLGVYMYLAPASWILADLSAAWSLSSRIAGACARIWFRSPA